MRSLVLSGQADIDKLKLYELEEEVRVLKNHAEVKGWWVFDVVRDVDMVEERNGLSRPLNMARNGDLTCSSSTAGWAPSGSATASSRSY